jgi:hypothetical protein
MDKPSIAYMPRPNSTPRTERDALANVLRFVLDCHAKRKAAEAGGPDDAKEFQSDCTATKKYT